MCSHANFLICNYKCYIHFKKFDKIRLPKIYNVMEQFSLILKSIFFIFVHYCSYFTLPLYSMCHDKILGKLLLTIFFNVLSVWLSFILLNLNKMLIIEQTNETSTKILTEKDFSSITPYHSSFPPALELCNRFPSVLFDVLFFLNIPVKWDYEFTWIQRPICMVKWNQRAIEHISLSIICSDVQWCNSIV